MNGSKFKVQGSRFVALFSLFVGCSLFAERTEFYVNMNYTPSQTNETHFASVQEAVTAAWGNADGYNINIFPGRYREKVHLTYRPNITMRGVSGNASDTIISWNDSFACGHNPDGSIIYKDDGTVYGPGTDGSATFGLFKGCEGFEMNDITVENTSWEESFASGGDGAGMALAAIIHTYGCTSIFRRCRFTGYQDTLEPKGGYCYFEDCFISGSVDFIFAGAPCVFNRCELHSRIGGYITAGAHGYDSKIGFLFYKCRVTSASDADGNKYKTCLGRAWRDGANVWWVDCDFGDAVADDHWAGWYDNPDHTVYREYGCRSDKAGNVQNGEGMHFEKIVKTGTLDDFWKEMAAFGYSSILDPINPSVATADQDTPDTRVFVPTITPAVAVRKNGVTPAASIVQMLKDELLSVGEDGTITLASAPDGTYGNIEVNVAGRGTFVFDLVWENGALTKLAVSSTTGGLCVVRNCTMRFYNPLLTTYKNVAGFDVELLAGETITLRALDGNQDWTNYCGSMTDDFLQTDEAVRIARNVLAYQRSSGGWPKNLPMQEELSDRAIAAVESCKEYTDGTIDNVATITEMNFLARMYKVWGKAEYLEALKNGIDFLFSLQYETGGFAQTDRRKKGYWSLVTMNDGAMANAVNTMAALRDAKAPFDFDAIDAALRAKCSDSFNLALDFILKSQVRQNGVPTMWCMQHNPTNYLPEAGRAFELAAITPRESVGVANIIMNASPVTAEMYHSISNALVWFKASAMRGYTIGTIVRDDGETAKALIKTGNENDWTWARFYDIDTNKPFTATRESVKIFEEDGWEQTQGYGWGYLWFYNYDYHFIRSAEWWLNEHKGVLSE